MNILKEKLKELGYEYYRRIGNTHHFRKYTIYRFFLHITTDINISKIKKYYIPNTLHHSIEIHDIGRLNDLINAIRKLENDIKILKGSEAII